MTTEWRLRDTARSMLDVLDELLQFGDDLKLGSFKTADRALLIAFEQLISLYPRYFEYHIRSQAYIISGFKRANAAGSYCVDLLLSVIHTVLYRP